MTAYYNEIDPGAAAWLRELIKAGAIAPGEVDERDILDVRPDELAGYTQCHFFAGIGVWSYALRLAGWRDDRPVWTGSCPCQPFSAAGKGTGFDDERHLWPAYFHLIEERHPPVIFGEQVASTDGLAWLDLVQFDLEGEGYACGFVDTCAAGFGAPHIRQRLYFVADSAEPRRQSWGGYRQQSNGYRPTWVQSRRFCDVGRLANTDGRHTSTEWQQRGGEQRQQSADSMARVMGIAKRAGLEGHAGDGDSSARWPQPPRPIASAGIVSGFWNGAELIYCRDNKFRPVEPGTFPLAHGASARVGRLRGYGNAIVAEAAKEVIAAYMETL